MDRDNGGGFLVRRKWSPDHHMRGMLAYWRQSLTSTLQPRCLTSPALDRPGVALLPPSGLPASGSRLAATVLSPIGLSPSSSGDPKEPSSDARPRWAARPTPPLGCPWGVSPVPAEGPMALPLGPEA